MAIISRERFNSEDIYLDYSFENVMFRRDHETGKVFRKFYSEEECQEPVHFSNRLYSDTNYSVFIS
jgi:hypothetical protein